METGPPIADLLRREPRELRAHRRGAGASSTTSARARPTSSRATRARTASSCRTSCRRAAFALRFGSLDPLISGQINSNTKLLMERDIRARVTKLAPFLQFDADPYPVVARQPHGVGHGRLHHDRPVPVLAVARRSRARSRRSFNYVRNSVKVDGRRLRGHGHLLRVRRERPDHQGLPRRRSPTSSPTASRMPEAIREHLRYPRGPVHDRRPTMFGRYHVTEPKRFYDGSAKWLVSPDPGSGRVVERHPVAGQRSRGHRSGSSSNQPQAASSTGARIDPDYLQHPAAGAEGGALHHHRAVRPGVVGQQPDAPRVVPHRATPIPGSTARCSRSRCRRVRPSRARSRSTTTIIRTPGDLDRDHAAEPAGLADHPGQHAADPGRQLDALRAAVLRAERRQRAATRCSSSSWCTTQGYGAICGQTVQDALDQMLGPQTGSSACNVSRRDCRRERPTHRRRPRPPRAGRDHDHRAVPADDHRRRRRSGTAPGPASTRRPTKLDQAQAALEPGSASTRTWSRRRRCEATSSGWSVERRPNGPPELKPGPLGAPRTAGVAAGEAPSSRRSRGWGSAPGIVTMGVVEIPAEPCGEPQ